MIIFKSFRVLALQITAMLLVLSASATTYTVTNTLDNTSSGSLRWAINQVNGGSGTGTINFNITGGTAPYLIVLGSALPTLTNPVLLDGTTQAPNGYTGNEPKITIQGDRTTINYGIDLSSTAGSSLIKGITIEDFHLAGVNINATGCTIQANVIISIGQIGGGTAGHGIYVKSVSGTIIKGNSIGVDMAGTAGLGSTGSGIYMNDNSVTGTIIGTTTPGDANIIANNSAYGIIITDGDFNPFSGNTIYGNTSGAISLAGTGNQNNSAPVLTSFGSGVIHGTLSSVSYPAKVEVFSSNAAKNAMEYLGTVSVSASGSWALTIGSATWTNFVATSTSAGNSTSELSNFLEPATCSLVMSTQSPAIELTLPLDFAEVDPTTASLGYTIHSVPALNYPVTDNQYHLRLEIAPETNDPGTGAVVPDWSSAVGFDNIVSSITPAAYTQALASYVTSTNYRKNYFWRIGIQYQLPFAGHQPVLWSPVYKFVTSPTAVAIPAAAYLTDPTQHTNDINWVYGVSYLDNGLTSEGIAYIDGLGKSRQVQSLTNTTNTVMAVEASYSEEGGGTVMTLPAPITGAAMAGRFGYSYNFFDVFDGTNWSDFSTKDFDREVKGTTINALMTPTAIDGTNGVGKYYSSTNTDSYVDDGMGYPYAYNVSYNSPLQRPMLSAAGVGVDFKMTSGKEMKHFYGQPSQEELDRVYGVAKAPLREKISRTITYNPDGVGSVKYTDNEGKLIATALTVCNAPSLNALSEDGMSGFTVHVDPLNTDVMDPTTLERKSSSKFFIPCSGTAVTLKYDLDLNNFQLNSDSPCMDCKYDVTIKLVNENTGAVIDLTDYNSTDDYTKALIPSATTCGGSAEHVSVINEIVTLDGPANYTINRIIKPYTDPTTGENVLTAALDAYQSYLSTNMSSLLSTFTTQYNTQTDYYVLRKQKVIDPNATISDPCTLSTSIFTGSSSGSAAGTAAAATYNNPAGIAKGNTGDFFIADAGNNTIRKVTAAGNVILLAGSSSGTSGFTDATGTAARFSAPNDVVFRPYIGLGSDTYPASAIVADKSNDAIRMVDESTGATTTLANSASGISAPEGLGIDAFGTIYIASTGNNKIYKMDLSSGSPVLTQIASSYTFNQPVDITMLGTDLYIVDKGTHSLLTIDAGGTVSTVSTSFTTPVSVSAEASGNVFVSDQGANKIKKVILATGSVSVVAGTGTAGATDGNISAAQFSAPVGLYAESSSRLYIADKSNNRIRIADFSSCITTSQPTTTYPWYPDLINVNDISVGSYTKELDQLDGDMDLDPLHQPGDEHYKVTSITNTGALTLSPTPDPIVQDFIDAYLRVNWVDLTGKLTSVDLYSVGASSELNSSTISTINENDALATGDQRTYYLLKVTFTKPSCSDACTYIDHTPSSCSDQCHEQQLALKADMDAAFNLVTASPFHYYYSGAWHTLSALVTEHFPLSIFWLTQLTDPDQTIYLDYQAKREAYELFNVSDCISLCGGGTPDPCHACASTYVSCVSEHMAHLLPGYHALLAAWDDPVANPSGTFPYTYSDLIHTSGGTTYPDAVLSDALGVEFLNYLAANISSTPILTRSYWNLAGGSCTNCQAASTSSPSCPAASPMDMTGFPTMMIPLLETLNADCADIYNGCLQMHGSPTDQNNYLCAQNRDQCIAFYGAEPMISHSDPIWIAWNTNTTNCATEYTNCLSGASPPTTVDLQRQDLITQTLLQLYPDPSQAGTVSTLLASLLTTTASMSFEQLQQYMDEYLDEQQCILSCEQNLTNAFNQWIQGLEDNAANTVNQSFIDGCYGHLNEVMDISFQESIYHYTLYNYDYSNNLVSTVPPEGIDYIDLTDAAQYTASPRASRTPAHRMVSTYKSTSLYTITASSPDDGSTRYLYDKDGRLRFSQTAEQLARGTSLGYTIFSYVKYDNDYRIIESGEYRDLSHNVCRWSREDCVGLCPACFYPNYSVESMADVVNYPNTPGYTFEETYIIYDNVFPALPSSAYAQTYVQGRVSETYNRDATTNVISNISRYSYDAHGRVLFVVQIANAYGPGYNKYKTTDYIYQGLTSKIDQVIYQKGKLQEEFRHKYTYDDDYRLVKVEVSRDAGVTWLQASEYDYYLHGPVKRIGLGNKIQDEDYVYNINGWLKAINNPLTTSYDNDGNESTGGTDFAPDVFSEAINYYNGDYKRTSVGLDNSALTVPQSGTQFFSNVKDLFSGNISSTVTNTAFNLTSMGSPPGNILAQGYRYDYLDRLTDVYAEVKPESFTAFDGHGAPFDDRYGSHITYDANGNIQTLVRNTMSRTLPGGGSPTTEMDNLTYHYAQTTTDYNGNVKKTNNRLAHVNDVALSETTLDDIKDEGSGYVAGTPSTHNYKYDAKGRITSDVESNITLIEWTSDDKVKKITKSDGTIISFTYSSNHQRLTKKVDPPGAHNDVTTIYSYDAGGLLMATYEYSYNSMAAAYQYKLLDDQMYGMGRIGTYNINEILVTSPAAPTNDASKEFFEITDHIGSVRAVVNGVKTSGNATIIQMSDYHEFGQTMQGRSFVSTAYRYGYQGSEKDAEVDGGSYTTDFRALDVRLGRWFAPDPVVHPAWSPYVSMNDNPIWLNDPAGDDPTDPPVVSGPDDGCTGSECSASDNAAGLTNGGGGNSNTSNSLNLTTGTHMNVDFGGGNTAGQAQKQNANKQTTQKKPAKVASKITAKPAPKAKAITNATVDDKDIWDQLVDGAKALWDYFFGSKPLPIPTKTVVGKAIPCVLDETDFISQVDPDIDPKKTWKECFQTCKKIVEAAGGSVCDGQSGYYMSNDDGDELTDAEDAITKIDEILATGKPVVIGVNYKEGSGNNDKATDHFVVIVGRGVEKDGTVYYNFWDVGVEDTPSGHAKGTSKDNKLTRKGNLLTSPAHRKTGPVTYVSSWLRISKPKS